MCWTTIRRSSSASALPQAASANALLAFTGNKALKVNYENTENSDHKSNSIPSVFIAVDSTFNSVVSVLFSFFHRLLTT